MSLLFPISTQVDYCLADLNASVEALRPPEVVTVASKECFRLWVSLPRRFKDLLQHISVGVAAAFKFVYISEYDYISRCGCLYYPMS